MDIDPTTLVQAGTAAWAALRLCHGAATWLTLIGRARLVHAVAALPPGTQLVGRGWQIRVPARRVKR